MDDNAKLCYVSDSWAYFTTGEISDVTGDDWNDAPYYCNAGLPRNYTFKVAWEAILEEAGYFYDKHWMSTDDINAGHYPWLQTPRYGSKETLVKIWAGTTFAEFKRLIAMADGRVYVPVVEDENN